MAQHGVDARHTGPRRGVRRRQTGPPADLVILDLQDYRQLTDAGLVHFKDSKDLQFAFLQNTQVSDVGLGHLKDHKNLGHLSLNGTKVTAAGIDELKKALPGCRIEWDGGVIEPR